MKPTAIDEAHLEASMTALEAARPWSPRVLSRLESFVRTAADVALFRVNPSRFAATHSVEQDESIELFLHAHHNGLFVMEWNLVCSCCARLFRSLRTMAELPAHFKCDMCRHDTETALDDWVHVTFTVSPRIRRLPFHDLESLDARDYYRHVLFCEAALFPGDEPVAEGWQQLFVDFVRLAPGEHRDVHLTLAEGAFEAIDFPLGNSVVCSAVVGSETATATRLTIHDDRLDISANELGEDTTIDVHNESGHVSFLALQLIPQSMMAAHEPPAIRYTARLTARDLLVRQTFRELFRFETIGAGTGLIVRDLTLLFTDLQGSTALYERIGDLNAFTLVHQHFAALADAVRSHGGAIVKTIGDAVMASFPTPAAGLLAARAMLDAIVAFNARGGSEALIVKIGLHRGPVIAVELNDRVDYFGQTVNIAARVQAIAGAGEVVISHALLQTDGLDAVLVSFHGVDDRAQLKGLTEPVSIRRLTPRPDVRAGR